MNSIQIAKILQRVSEHPVGTKEAAVLFSFDNETTYAQIIERLGISKRTAWSRIAVLKQKGLVETRHLPHGGIYHILTKEGRRIVSKTTDFYV
jgi:DNA-binding MarR family transcriptional regulator